MFGKIKKGDPVRVRLSNGEVVVAVYIEPSPQVEKCHIVKIGKVPYLALGGKYARKGVRLEHECRFVGPTPVVIKGEQQWLTPTIYERNSRKSFRRLKKAK